MLLKIIFIFTLITYFINFCSGQTTDGFCTYLEPIEKIQNETETYLHLETSTIKCGLLKKCQRIAEVKRTRVIPVKSIISITSRRCCDGYGLVNGNKCVPICEPQCQHSYCVAPNKCNCYDGYKHEMSNKCTPICSNCENGVCVAADQCVCNEGFNWDYNGNKCIPHCENSCINGKCIAPNQCKCNVGYKMENQTCKVFCENACMNGICIAPNECECLPGYLHQFNSQTICEPTCYPECINGSCSDSNECVCAAGYKLKMNNICEFNDEKPHENNAIIEANKQYTGNTCINGNFNSNGKCICFPEYHLDVRNNFICIADYCHNCGALNLIKWIIMQYKMALICSIFGIIILSVITINFIKWRLREQSQVNSEYNGVTFKC